MSSRRPIYLPRERWRRTTRMEKGLSRLGDWFSDLWSVIVTLFHSLFHRTSI